MYAIDSTLAGVAASLVARWEKLPGSPERVRQTWIVMLTAAQDGLAAELLDALRAAAEEGLTRAEEEAHLARSVLRPHVQVAAIDEQNVLIQIEVAHPSQDQVNSWLVVSSWVLRRLDAELGISSVYGIAKKHWLILK
jgi:hypothetical protein